MTIYKKFYGSNSTMAKFFALLPFYKTFRSTYTFLQKSQWLSKEQLEQYQLHELKKLVKHAYENVPYYRRIFDERHLKPEDIQQIADLKKLPFLTKEIIRDNLRDLTAKNYTQDELEYVTTGGSTGIPLGFYYHKGISHAHEEAFIKNL